MVVLSLPIKFQLDVHLLHHRQSSRVTEANLNESEYFPELLNCSVCPLPSNGCFRCPERFLCLKQYLIRLCRITDEPLMKSRSCPSTHLMKIPHEPANV